MHRIASKFLPFMYISTDAKEHFPFNGLEKALQGFSEAFLSRFDELRHGSVTSGYVGCIYTITTFEFDIWISTDEISGETEADHSLLPYTIVIH